MHCEITITKWNLLVLIVLMVKGLETADDTEQYISYQHTCPPGCSSCSAVNGCLSCHAGLYLFLWRDGVRQTGLCLKSCPREYYAVELPNMKRCFECRINNCETCYSSSYCKECASPYSLFNGKCVIRCPHGLFYESYSHTCITRVDCAVGEWSTWSDCTRNSQICGYKYGLQSRTRETIQNPSPSGLACPALKEYRQCRMMYRYCADLENNYSKLVARIYADNLRRQRRRRARGRCVLSGRLWNKGRCFRRHKNIIDFHLTEILENKLETTKPSKSVYSLNDVYLNV